MVDSAPALSLQAILSDPTVVQFLRQLSSQLVMWPSTYLAIMPVFRAGRISRRVYYGLLVASVALALSCSVVYVLYPDVRTAFFIGTSVAAIIVEWSCSTPSSASSCCSFSAPSSSCTARRRSGPRPVPSRARPR